MTPDKLFLADCHDILPVIQDASVRLVVSSPPYNIGKAYEKAGSTVPAYVAEQSAVLAALAAKLTPGGSLCWQVGNYVSGGEAIPIDSLLIPVIRGLGLKIRNRIVWTFGHGLHCSKRLSGRHETIIWATKGDDYLFDLDAIRVPQKFPGKKHFKGPKAGELSGNPRGKNPGDVWDISNVKHNHPEKTAHPCQFPEELVSRLIRSLTEPGDVVLDPYAGSGTTGAAAMKANRRFILIEREPAYVAIAANRLGLAHVGAAA